MDGLICWRGESGKLGGVIELGRCGYVYLSRWERRRCGGGLVWWYLVVAGRLDK